MASPGDPSSRRSSDASPRSRNATSRPIRHVAACRRVEPSAFGCCRIASSRAACSSAWRSHRRGHPLQGIEALAKFGACAEVLERIIETIRTRPEEPSVCQAVPFDDPTWVSNRLSEILPIPMRARQKLMELDDAAAPHRCRASLHAAPSIALISGLADSTPSTSPAARRAACAPARAPERVDIRERHPGGFARHAPRRACASDRC